MSIVFRPTAASSSGSEAIAVPFPQAGAEERNEAPQAAASKEPLKERTPRVDWAELLRRTFDLDVFACVRCGGRRRVLAYVTAPRGTRHSGAPDAHVDELAPPRGAPSARGVESQAVTLPHKPTLLAAP